MRRPCRNVFALLLLCLPIMPTLAQDAATTPPPAKITKPKSKTATPKKTTTKSKSANIKVGVITAIDAENSTISLQEKSATNNYTLTEKTRYRKAKAEVELAAFKVGEQVTLKLRKVRGKDEYTVQELLDPVSGEQMEAIRKKQMQATIQKIEDGELSVTFANETEPFTYTTSDKTLWSKAGKDVEQSEFKPGDVVTVAPRSLPSGNVMAAIVADTAQDATRTKERHARTVTGQISLLDASKSHVILILNPQDTREFTYAPTTLVMLGSRTVPVTALKIGQRIRATLKQSDDALPEASRITIETKKTKTAGAKKSPAKKADVQTGADILVPTRKR